MRDLATAFLETTARIVWCTVATVDTAGRPRSRILHPIWEHADGRLTGWVLTGRTPVKSAHLARTPFVSCSYWDQEQHTAIAECEASWVEDLATKQHVYDLFQNTPPPLGYDMGGYGPEGAANPIFTPLRLDPWRVHVMTFTGWDQPLTPRVWVRGVAETT